MALAVDSEMASNVGFGVAGSPVTSPKTYTFNNGAGTLLLLLDGIGSAGAQTVTAGAASYNAVAATKILERATSGSTTGGRVVVYQLLSPSTGSQTASQAWTKTGSEANEVWGGCISFTGHDLVTPVVQSVVTSGTGAQASATLTGVAAGNITVCVFGGGSAFTTQSQTLSWAKNVDDNTSLGNGRCSRSSASGSVTHTADMTGSDSWVAIMLEIAAAAGAAVTTPPRTMVGPNAAAQRAANWCKGEWQRRGSGIYVRPRGIVVPRPIT